MRIALCQAPYSLNDGPLLLDQLKMKTLCLWLIPVLILLLLGSIQVETKKYQRCELTRVLVENYNFDKTFISNCKWFAYEVKTFIKKKIFWTGICLVEHESYLDTRKITKKENESKNYGLFQINSRDYCTEGRKGGQCNMKCEGEMEIVFYFQNMLLIGALK